MRPSRPQTSSQHRRPPLSHPGRSRSPSARSRWPWGWPRCLSPCRCLDLGWYPDLDWCLDLGWYPDLDWCLDLGWYPDLSRCPDLGWWVLFLLHRRRVPDYRDRHRRTHRTALRSAPARCHRSEEHTSELQSPCNLVCRLLLEKKKKKQLQTCKHD